MIDNKMVPKKWEKTRIGEYFDVTNGKTNVDDAVINGKYPLFDRSVLIKKSNKYLFDKEALIIPGEGKEFLPRYFLGKFDLHQRAYAIFSKENLDVNIKFLYHWMNYRKDYLIQSAVGSTVKSLRLYMINDFPLLLPPLDIQQKIALILSTVDEEIQKTDQIIQKIEKLKQGVMQNVLGFKNKEDVRYLALRDVGKVSMCKRIFKNETLNTGDIPFYKIGTFGKEPDSFISQKLYDDYYKRFSFPKIGDVLLSASGTIGRKVKYDGRPAYFQDSNIIWLEHDESKVLNDFLFYLYDTISWQTEGSTIKRLYNNIFLKKIIPVPSIEKQRETVEILLAIDNKISTNIKLREVFTLFKEGLMNDIFSQKVEVKNVA